MKTVIRSLPLPLPLLLAALAALTFIGGCGSKNDGNNSGNNNMYCDPYTGYCSSSPGYGTNPNTNTIILSGGITVANSSAYKDLLNGMYGCDNGPINTCSMINNASPRVEIVLNDYLFGGAVNSTPGTVRIFSQQIPGAPTGVNWHKVNNNTQIDTQVLYPYEYDNKLMRITLTGLATDSYLPIEIYYGSKLVGTGTINRVIR